MGHIDTRFRLDGAVHGVRDASPVASALVDDGFQLLHLAFLRYYALWWNREFFVPVVTFLNRYERHRYRAVCPRHKGALQKDT